MLTLQQLKTYLQTHGQTALTKLSLEFGEEPNQIMLMAQHYIAKNKIYCERRTVNCGSKCNNCFASQLVKLSWVDTEPCGA